MEAAAVEQPAVEQPKDVKLSALRSWEGNPRRITKRRMEALKQSMLDAPTMMRARPLIALPDGEVIGGNQRLAAALELVADGHEEWSRIRVTYVHGLTRDQARTWALRDNNPYGEWDDDMLAMMVAELARDEIDLALTGFDDDEIARLLELLAGHVLDKYEAVKGAAGIERLS